MKKLFSPILNIFERADGRYTYKPLYRTILRVLAGLFLVIALSSLYVAVAFSVMGGLIPTVVFLAASMSKYLTCCCASQVCESASH